MKNFKLTNDDIQFLAEQIIKLQQSDKPFNCETVAQDIMAGLIVCNIKNGG
jgi:hypothetical protein